ncbi:MAG: LacI family DNA-binding transcriptional regulator [Akkermansiaceae bacterium]|nr:LacI family DNA-binding transcriptional regulator [Akkermansiaceae bacterium]
MPTINDIARKVGVSASTVSRALNGSRLISAAMRDKIDAVARDAGYDKRPNRRHRGRAILNVKLVLPRHSDPERSLFYDFAALVEGLRRGFTLCGLNLLCEVNAPGFKPFPHKKGGDIDAFVFAFHRPAASLIKKLERHDVPFVVLNRAIPDMPCVAVDHDLGMLELLDHLIGRMKEIRPKFISIEDLGSIHEERLAAFDAACRLRRIAFDPEKDCLVFENTAAIQWEGMAEAGQKANVLICVNDIVGTVILSELFQNGLEVPGQIAVTGFDDSPVRRLSRPMLTTVSLPVEELAEQAALRLQKEIIENQPSGKLQRLSGKVIPGDSTP